MKNITVSVDSQLYHKARIRAAEKGSTVSALVREFLTHLVNEEPAFERMQREQNDIIARIRASQPGFAAGDRLSREQIHDRHAVR